LLLESCFKFVVALDHDTVRQLLKQPNDKLNKREARFVRDLQLFMGAMTLAYCKDSKTEAYTLSRRADFYAQPSLPLFWDCDVPHHVNPREQSQLPRSRDAAMASQNVDTP
jgi:hypothetical protein